MLRDDELTRARESAIGAVAIAVFVASSIGLVLLVPSHAVTGWPVVAVAAAGLIRVGNHRDFVLGLGAESEVHMTAAPAILFGAALLVPPAVVPLLALMYVEIEPGRRWPRVVTGPALDVAGAFAALVVAQTIAMRWASGPYGAVLVASSIAAAVTWCVVNAGAVSLLCHVAMQVPLRLSPMLTVAAQIPVVVQASLGVAGAVLLRYSAWNAPIVALLVWVNFRYIAAHSAAQASRADDMTGLPGKGEFVRTAEREIARANRTAEPLSVLMLDLDHFRRVNSDYGHLTADDVLIEVAQRVRTELRLSDVAGRFGGEEFSILLPGTDGARARGVAERIRLAIAAAPVRTEGASVPVTVSVGVAEHQPGEPISATLRRADDALYDAKDGGRNRVESRLALPEAL